MQLNLHSNADLAINRKVDLNVNLKIDMFEFKDLAEPKLGRNGRQVRQRAYDERARQ